MHRAALGLARLRYYLEKCAWKDIWGLNHESGGTRAGTWRLHSAPQANLQVGKLGGAKREHLLPPQESSGWVTHGPSPLPLGKQAGREGQLPDKATASSPTSVPIRKHRVAADPGEQLSIRTKWPENCHPPPGQSPLAVPGLMSTPYCSRTDRSTRKEFS